MGRLNPAWRGKLALGLMILVGILGLATSGIRPPLAAASPATSISSISVSSTCDSQGGFTGTVTLSGTFTGTVVLGLFYHVPGGSQFVDSGRRANAVFSGTSTAVYQFAAFSFAGANSYRIQVIDSGGLGGSTVKSNSVPPCTGTPPPPPPPPPPSSPCGNSSSTVPTTSPGSGPFLGPLGHGSTLPPTTGTIQDYSNSCSPNGSKITVGSQAETVSSICAYVGPVAAAPENQFSVAIYADASGTPGALLTHSAVGVLTADSWNCVPISATLQANTAYWLMFWSNSSAGSSGPGAGPAGSGVCPDDTHSGADGNLCYINGPAGSGAFWQPAALTTFPTWSTPLSAGGFWVLGPWQFSIVAVVSP
ncbi:MAG TPA: choice-of-anchor R domain-containing protein [Dehalococcoidia bacterium]|nr:choice-of-anchor R domain-containing protein [Dehalococcoidia bacterium]